MTRWLGWTAFLLLGLLASCGAPPNSSNPHNTTTGKAGLVAFQSCGELESYIQDTAVLLRVGETPVRCDLR